MRHHNSVFHQLLQFVPWDRFDRAVEVHAADVRVRRLTTKSQFIALLYAQLAGAQSLREIEQAMASHKHRLYHLGATAPARSTLADANANRPAQLFADMFAVLATCASAGLRRATREAVHLIDAINGRLKTARGASHPLAGIPLREVVVAREDGRTLRLITNDLEASAEHIAELYRARWQIELFFRWVKQNLKIKRFLGTSENAVRTQIAVALIAYLILRMAREAAAAPPSLLAFARLVRANLMHRRPVDNLADPRPPIIRDTCQTELPLC